MTSELNLSFRLNAEETKDDRCIPDFIRHWSETRPKDEAFVFLSYDGTSEVVTWRDLYDNAMKYARAFIALGIKEQDIVAIALNASAEWLYATFGVIFAGAIALPLLITYKDCSDVVQLLNKLGKCTTIVLDPGREETHWPVLRSFLTSVDKKGAASSIKIPSLKYMICMSAPKDEPGLFTIDDFLNIATDHVRLPLMKPKSVIALFQTSGSTGIPKAVPHTHDTLVKRAMNVKPGPPRRVYNGTAFSSIASWPANIFSGDTRITNSLELGMMSEDQRVAFTFKVLKEESCSTVWMTPHFILLMMDAATTRESLPAGNRPLVDTIVVTGQPISEKVTSCVGTLCSKLTVLYGSTEGPCILSLTLTPADVDCYRSFCCGEPMKGVTVKIVDENEKTVPVNTKGEIYVRSPTLFPGYFNDEDRTRTAFTSDGWYKTGDIGSMAENGIFFVEGRKSEVIICRTHTIDPAPVENAIQSCPGIKACCVVPIPHEQHYQDICACVIPESGRGITADDVKQYCEDVYTDKAEAFTILPTYYVIFDHFPITRTGKVSRQQLALQAGTRIN